MSIHQGFRRQPVPQQVAQQHKAITVPAPSLGIMDSENLAYMKPGSAVVLDNWIPTMRGIKLRGGYIKYCDLHSLDDPVPPIGDPSRKPVISAFEYIDNSSQNIFAANADKLFDVSASVPVVVREGHSSGNYVASQMGNASGNHMLIANEAGDYLMHYDGLAWVTYDGGEITTNPAVVPPPTCAEGRNLTYVCKYRNRYFFIEGGTMNAWYLPLDAVQGQLNMIPMAGSATKGGKLIFCASWSIDAGDGIDDKLVFATNLGELLIFTGSNPSDPNNWRQEGRYQIPRPMGMNAHIQLGGDLLIATVDGLVPVSAAITKAAEQLDLAMLSRAIRQLWRRTAITNSVLPWSMMRWDEYGGMFVAQPGGIAGRRFCSVVNTGTIAWTRFTWDATCFMRLRNDVFFGTQDGIIMQADRTGYDDGKPYTCTMVGNWGMFGQQAQNKTWSQARVSFTARQGEPFLPQITACTDYVINLPPAPHAGIDPGPLDVWDQGTWDNMKWDAPALPSPTVRNTGWISIGASGFTHAPIVQVTVGQVGKPDVEMIAIDALYWSLGTNV